MTIGDRHLERLVAYVQRIAFALERIAPDEASELGPVPVLAGPDAGCLHPLDTRIGFGVTAGADDWLCGLCGYRSPVGQGDGNG